MGAEWAESWALFVPPYPLRCRGQNRGRFPRWFSERSRDRGGGGCGLRESALRRTPSGPLRCAPVPVQRERSALPRAPAAKRSCARPLPQVRLREPNPLGPSTRSQPPHALRKPKPLRGRASRFTITTQPTALASSQEPGRWPDSLSLAALHLGASPPAPRTCFAAASGDARSILCAWLIRFPSQSA